MLLAWVAIWLVFHARAPGIQVTAWLMQHEVGDSAVQLRVALRVWNLRTDQAIDVILYAGLVLFSKDQMEVGCGGPRFWNSMMPLPRMPRGAESA